MALAPSQSSQIKPAPEPPRVGGDLHSIVGFLRDEIVKKRQVGPSAQEIKRIEDQLHRAATLAIAQNPKLTADMVRKQYQLMQNPVQVARNQMEQAAGIVPSSLVGKGPETQDEEVIEESAPEIQGQQLQTDFVPMQSGEVPNQKPVDAVPEQNRSLGQDQKPANKDSAKQKPKDGRPDDKPISLNEQKKSETPSKKKEKPKNEDDYLKPSTTSGQVSGKKPGAKAPTSGAARASKDMLGPDAGVPATGKNSPFATAEQAKQVEDAFRQAGVKEGAKAAVRLAAQQGADKAFWALLDASPADLGILTIGVGGTFLLVLGHMFDVELQPWQKWLVLIYDGVLGLVLLFAIVIQIFLFCNTFGLVLSECSSLKLWNILF